MNEMLANRVKNYFSESNILFAGPVPEEEISALEKWIEFRLPEAYKWFVRHYGGGIIGHLAICGIGASEAMARGDISAKEKTSRFRAQTWPGIEGWLVISSDAYGNPIGINHEGKIAISELDSCRSRVISNSFEELLEKLLEES